MPQNMVIWKEKLLTTAALDLAGVLNDFDGFSSANSFQLSLNAPLDTAYRCEPAQIVYELLRVWMQVESVQENQD
jgi:hypothetical protein